MMTDKATAMTAADRIRNTNVMAEPYASLRVIFSSIFGNTDRISNRFSAERASGASGFYFAPSVPY
jgi:hypothetical protein